MTTMLISSKKQDEGIKKDAEYVINAVWPSDMDCDVDLWVQDPNGNAVWFNRKDLDIMHLERDDMGLRNDIVKDRAGNVIGSVNKNGETWVLRGIMSGEFYVSVHLYSCRFQKVSFVPMPIGYPVEVPVTVELIKLNPSYRLLVTEKVTFQRVWEEITPFNFTLGPDGELVSTDKTQHKLVVEKQQ